MLNRRILRIKAFKVIYAYAIREDMTPDEALSYLDKSCEAVRDLYVFMMGMVSPLSREEGLRIEAAKGKFSATDEELSASDKFSSNALAKYLDEDIDFTKQFSARKFSWDNYDIFLRELLDSVRGKEYYSRYMAEPSRSLTQDCRLFSKIYETELDENPRLQGILEDMNIYWVDDLAYALSWCCRSFDDISKGKGWALPELYMSDVTRRRKPSADVESDSDFVHKLTVRALSAYKRVFDRVVASVPNWDKDRLFAADMAILALGVAERENFPQIPMEVTLNEWVEISKFYCSPKSRQFVNGLLDKLVKGKDLKEAASIPLPSEDTPAQDNKETQTD